MLEREADGRCASGESPREMTMKDPFRAATLALAACAAFALRPAPACAAPNSDTWLKVSRVERAPAVDGRLDDAAWAETRQASGFTVLGKQKLASAQTHVKAVATSEALFIGILCDEPRIGQLVFKERPLDDKVWEDDSVELFLDSDNSKTDILHLIVNPAGSRYDGRIKAEGTATGRDLDDDETWNGDWKAACTRGARGWSVEVRIPFSTLGLQDGRQPRMMGGNFMRTRQAGETELSSWMPCQATFLEPMSHGEIALPDTDGSLVGLVCERAATQMVGQGAIEAGILNLSKKPARTRLKYNLSGPTSSVGKSGDLQAAPGGSTPQIIPLSIEKPGQYLLTLELEDADSGKPLGMLHRVFRAVRTVEIQEKLYAMLYRRIEAAVSVNLPNEQKPGATLRAVLLDRSGTKALAVKQMKAPESGSALVSFKAEGLPAGRYLVKATVSAAGGVSYTSFSRPYPYEPKPKVGFDRQGFLTVGGKPFFPVGMYTIQDKGGKNHAGLQKEAAQAGFNTTVFYAYTNSALLPLMDAAAQSGLKAFVYPTVPVSVRKGDETREQMIADVKARMSHPALLGWYIVDEPEGIGKASADVAEELYRLVKETDPQHPCSMVTMSPTAAGLYRDGTDIMWVDPYPIPHAPADTVGKVTAGAVAAVEKDKPVWVIPQAFDWGIWRDGKFLVEGVHRPTDAEERCMTYLALVNGAKGIIYWAFLGSRYSILDYPEHWAYMKKLAGEMRTLTPALLTPSVTGVLKTAPADAPLDTMLKRVAGQWYVFAVNRNPQSCSARITLPKALKAKTAEVLFEKRSVGVAGGSWKDDFKPLDVHVYRLAAD